MVNLVLGTRDSRLALEQTQRVIRALQAHDPTLSIQVRPIRTTGDRIQNRTLQEIGGKGLFVKELQQAILDGTIDAAVHSLKDMEVYSDPRLQLTAMLPRESPHDVLVSQHGYQLATLPPHARLGTSSPRRTQQLQDYRPDLVIVPVRGNLDARLKQLEVGAIDALILAEAGLARLELQDRIDEKISLETMIPAAGQGTIAVECLVARTELQTLFASIHCEKTGACARAERAVVRHLEGDCYTPIGAYATYQEDGSLSLQGYFFDKRGYRVQAHGNDPDALGKSVAVRLKEGASV